MSDRGQPPNAWSSPEAAAARVATFTRSVAGSLQGGWRDAATPALAAYLVTFAVSFLTLGTAALISAGSLGGGNRVVLAFKVALAGVAMAFRGALVLGGSDPTELTPGGDWHLIAPPLGLALVGLAALVWFTRRRTTGSAAEAFRVGLCFAGMVAAGALLVRTSRDVFSLGDLTVRVALPGLLFWATVAAGAAVWLGAPGRARRVVTEGGGDRLAGWRLPFVAGLATVAAVWAAAMVGGGLYGMFKAITEDGLTGGDRLSGLLVGFTYLPVIGAFGAGIAGGANLVGPSELGYDRLVIGWFGEQQPEWWWAFASAAVLALVVAGGWWIASRVTLESPWRPAFVGAFAAAWTAMALLSQFVLRPSGGRIMTFGLGTLGAIGTGVVLGAVAVAAGHRLVARSRIPG